MSQQSLEGKVALVTGGGDGIGKAIAERFCREGAQVIIADINPEAGKRVAESLGSNAEFIQLDVSQEDEWKRVVEVLDKQYGRLDILVNNAGISPHDSIENFDTDLWNKVHSVVLDSVAFGCKHGLSLLKKSQSAAIVNISSIVAMIGAPTYLSYGAAKAGVRTLTKSVAMYCAQEGYPIRCNSIHPGSVDTAILDADKLKHGKAAIEMREAAIPLGRLGQAHEVASAVLFLASDESSYITAIELPVDGGYLAK